jgi:FtsP/CotA-like multicopper oxidase with cupredoxin domain
MHRALLVAVFLGVGMPVGAQPPIAPNDNTTPAGSLRDERLTLRLYAGAGTWRPEGDDGPTVVVQAFGEEGQPLRTPGPLIRVPAGTTIDVTVRNALDVPLALHGFAPRPAARGEATVIGVGESRRITFAAGKAVR